MQQPIILCGLGRIGLRVLEYLQAGHFPTVVIDTTCEPGDPRLGNARLVRGDCRRQDVLLQAGIKEARGVLIVTSDDLVNITAALTVRQLHAEVRIIVRMVNQKLIRQLGKAVHQVHALSLSNLAGPLLALTARTGQALGTLRVQNEEEGRRQISEISVPIHSPLQGRRLDEVMSEHHAVALFHRSAGDAPRFFHEVDPETRLMPGDRLVICAHPRDAAELLSGAAEDVAPHVKWASLLRRNGRVLWRTMSEIDRAVLICTAVLLAVILISTVVLWVAVPFDSLPTALFRTIGLMATGADMHEEAFKIGWLKVFASGLRILGAALTAAFTAIVTNYLLRAQLGGALEVRRIPDSGHIIVCGLGNVGFRVVEDLIEAGEQVVVIEVAGQNPLVTTARRLGAPVILADATVREVLRQAHAPTARAVVAATTNDLVNLEIALLARELNPKQRVVPCLADAHLAQSLRDAANIRLTVSVPTLAAPAFVAALFGDRVQSVFLLEGYLLAVVDLLVQPESFLAGHAVRAVARKYRLLPLALYGADGTAQEQPLSGRFEPGCRLVAVISLPDLERLFRREMPLDE